MKKIGVIQSNYIPWKGYFDIIHDSDLFIFYDDLQYTKNDWRNRNKIKSRDGTQWLTIPTGTNTNRLICEVELPIKEWQHKHWNSIKNVYQKTPYFHLYKDFFEYIYLESRWNYLSEFNQFIIKHISLEFLKINVIFNDSKEHNLEHKKLDRLIELIKKVNGNYYISGPSAKNYIDDKAFKDHNIELIYKKYDGYPEYPQIYPPFTHNVSIIDLLFHVGQDAPYYIWGWREGLK